LAAHPDAASTGNRVQNSDPQQEHLMAAVYLMAGIFVVFALLNLIEFRRLD
jgi:hypothetical protein